MSHDREVTAWVRLYLLVTLVQTVAALDAFEGGRLWWFAWFCGSWTAFVGVTAWALISLPPED